MSYLDIFVIYFVYWVGFLRVFSDFLVFFSTFFSCVSRRVSVLFLVFHLETELSLFLSGGNNSLAIYVGMIDRKVFRFLCHAGIISMVRKDKKASGQNGVSPIYFEKQKNFLWSKSSDNFRILLMLLIKDKSILYRTNFLSYFLFGLLYLKKSVGINCSRRKFCCRQ